MKTLGNPTMQSLCTQPGMFVGPRASCVLIPLTVLAEGYSDNA